MFSKFIGKKGRSSTQVTRGQSGGEVVIRSFMEELLCTSEMNLGCDHWQVPPNSKTIIQVVMMGAIMRIVPFEKYLFNFIYSLSVLSSFCYLHS